MHNILIRFYGDLNDLVSKQKRQVEYCVNLKFRTSVKDLIESQGVPHPEIGLVLVNGNNIDSDILLKDGDIVSVYPKTGMFLDDVGGYDNFTGTKSKVSFISGKPERPLKFLLDVHLGKLASYLRLLGFDTLYFNPDISDPELVKIAVSQNRILLTMDRKLLMHTSVKYGRIIRDKYLQQQVVDVIDAFRCRDEIKAFTRCMECNTVLERADFEKIGDKIPARIKEKFYSQLSVFKSCNGCSRIYWPGSHRDRMVMRLREWGVAVAE